MEFYPVHAKPIFIVGVPDDQNTDASMQQIANVLSGKLPDYHILTYPTTAKALQFHAFYPKDMPVVEFEQFKEEVRRLANPEDPEGEEEGEPDDNEYLPPEDPMEDLDIEAFLK